MSKELEPSRRVTFLVTGYLKGGAPRSGWYDMRTTIGGSQEFCIPESAVDEASVRDAEPEKLTAYDWDDIAGTILGRLGQDRGAELLKRIHFLVDAFDQPPTPASQGVRKWLLSAILAQQLHLGEPTINLARRGSPIRLSGSEADELADRILTVLAANPETEDRP